MSRTHAFEAIRHVDGFAEGPPLPLDLDITINFHPDQRVQGKSVLERLVEDGRYRSQFETGVSNGGLTAFSGGARWQWEQRIFGGAYDTAPIEDRPKYGALNLRHKSVGAAPRFGACHFVLAKHRHPDVTFCYPDSHMSPDLFGTAAQIGFLAQALANTRGLDALDDYVEAHIHGELVVQDDIAACVLDPSYQGSALVEEAHRLPCEVLWHPGFVFHANDVPAAAQYRNPEAASVLEQCMVDGRATPYGLSKMRARRIAWDTLKKAWHCIAKFGDPDAHPNDARRHQ